MNAPARSRDLALAVPVAAGALLLAQAVLAEPPPPPSPPTVQVAADTWISSSPSHQNHGNEAVLKVGGSGDGRTLVRFDTAAILAALQGRALVGARLEVTIQGTSQQWGHSSHGTNARTVAAHRLRQAWTESGATWLSPSQTGSRPSARWDMEASDDDHDHHDDRDDRDRGHDRDDRGDRDDRHDDHKNKNKHDDRHGNGHGDGHQDDDDDDLPYDPAASAFVVVAANQSGTLSLDVTQDVAGFAAGAVPNEGWLLKRKDEKKGSGLLELRSRHTSSPPRLVLTLGSSTATTFVPVSGDGQSARAGEDVPQPLVVAVRDMNGLGVVGRPVTFSVQHGDATVLGPNVVTTNQQGQASARVRLGPTGGLILVGASTPGQPTLVFRVFALPPPAVLGPVADTYVERLQRDRAHGSEAVLRVQALGRHRAILRFDQPQLAAAVQGGQLERAVLELTIKGQVSSLPHDCHPNAFVVGAHRMVDGRWTEAGATWRSPNDTNPTNHRRDGPSWDMASPPLPFVAAATTSQALASGQSGKVLLDVTPDVARFLDGSAQNHGWLLRAAHELALGKVDFGSRESGTPPRLLLYVRDVLPPVITVHTPPATVYSGPTYPARATAIDDRSGLLPGSWEVVSNGQPVTTSFAQTTSSVESTLASIGSFLVQGTGNQLTFKVKDLAMNQGTASVTFGYDALGPQVDLQPADQAIVLSGSLTFRVQATDPHAGVDPNSLVLTLDGNVVAAPPLVGGVSVVDVPTTPGLHQVTAQVDDLVGNRTVVTHMVTLQPRGISGRVLGGSNPNTLVPVAGLRVRCLDGPATPVIETLTDSNGDFVLYGPPVGAQVRFVADGYLVGFGRTTFVATVVDQVVTPVGRPIVVPAVDGDDGALVTLDGAGRTTHEVVVTTPDASAAVLRIAAGAQVVLPNDGFTLPPGQPLRISLHRLVGTLEANSLPAGPGGEAYVAPGVYSMQPDGLEIVEGYTFALSNESSVAPAATTPLYLFNSRTGAWELKSQLTAGADRSTVHGVLNSLLGQGVTPRTSLIDHGARATLQLADGRQVYGVGQGVGLRTSVNVTSASTNFGESLSIGLSGSIFFANTSGPTPNGLFGLNMSLAPSGSRSGSNVGYLDRVAPLTILQPSTYPHASGFEQNVYYTASPKLLANVIEDLQLDGDNDAGVERFAFEYSDNNGVNWVTPSEFADSSRGNYPLAHAGFLGPMWAAAEHTVTLLDGNPLPLRTGVPESPGVPAGSYRFRIRALDTAGNLTPSNDQGILVLLDNAAPTYTNQGTNNPPDFQGPFETRTPAFVGFYAEDDSNLSRVELLANGQLFVASPSNPQFAPPGALRLSTNQSSFTFFHYGTHSFQLRAVDEAGNATLSHAVQYTFDDQGPVTSVQVDSPSITTANPRVVITATDAVLGLKNWQLFRSPVGATPGTTVQVASGSFSFGATSTQQVEVFDSVSIVDGRYQYRVVTTDRLDNTSEAFSNELVRDTVGPAVQVVPGDGAIRGPGPITILVIADDRLGVEPSTFQLTIDGARLEPTGPPVLSMNGELQRATFTVVVQRLVQPGAHAVRVEVGDVVAGFAPDHTTVVDQTIFQDHQAPTIDSLTGPAAVVRNPSVTFNAAYSDQGFGIDPARVRLFLRAPASAAEVEVTSLAAITTSTASVTLTLPDGTSSLRLVVADTAGTEVEATVQANVDTQAPLLTVVTAPQAAPAFTRATDGRLEVSIADAGFGTSLSSIKVYQDGVDVTAQAQVSPAFVVYAPATLSDGPHDYRVEAQDFAGGPASVTRTFQVDGTGPTRPGIPVAGAKPFTASTTIRWAPSVDLGAGLASYKVLRTEDGQTYTLAATTTSTDLVVPFPTGEKTAFRVVAVDALGNESPVAQVEGSELASLDDLTQPITTELVVEVYRTNGPATDAAVVLSGTPTQLVHQGNGVYRSAAITVPAGQPLNLDVDVDGERFVSGPLLPLLPETVVTDFGRLVVQKRNLRGAVFGIAGANPGPPGPAGAAEVGRTGGEACASVPQTNGTYTLAGGFWNTIDVEGDPTIDVLQTPPVISRRYVPVYFEVVADVTPVNVAAEVSLDNGVTWAPMTVVSGSGSLLARPGTPLGRRHVVVWDVGEDLAPDTVGDVLVRMYPVGLPLRGDRISATLLRSFSVESVSPPDGELQLDPAGPVALTFTRAPTTNAANLAASIVLEDRRSGTTLPVTFAVSGRTVQVTPQTPLTPDAEVRVVVSSSLLADGGDPIVFDQAPGSPGLTPFEATYRVGGRDHEPPQLVSSAPADGAVGVAPSTPILLTFNEDLDPTSVDNRTVTLTSNGGVTTTAVTLLGDQRTLLVQPSPAPLQPDRFYTASISPTLADVAGNALGQTVHVSFNTVVTSPVTPGPCVLTAPANGTVIAPPAGPPVVQPTTVITGTAPPNHAVRIHVNGYPTSLVASVDATGAFSVRTFPLPEGTVTLMGVVETPNGLASTPSAPVTVTVQTNRLGGTPLPAPGQPVKFEVVAGQGTDPNLVQRHEFEGDPGAPVQLRETTNGTSAGFFRKPTFTVDAANGGGTYTVEPGTELFTGFTYSAAGTFGLTCGGFDVRGDGVRFETIDPFTQAVTEAQDLQAVAPTAFSGVSPAWSGPIVDMSWAVRARTLEGDHHEVVELAELEVCVVAIDENGERTDSVSINGQPGSIPTGLTTDADGNVGIRVAWLDDERKPVRVQIIAKGVYEDTGEPFEVVIGEEILDPQGEKTHDGVPIATALQEPHRFYVLGANGFVLATGCPPNYPAGEGSVGGTLTPPATDPVLLHNGAMTLGRTDLTVAAPRGPGFAFARSFKGAVLYQRTLGHSWSHGYDQRLVREANGDVTWVTAGLRTERFRSLGGGRFETLGERSEALTVTGDVGTIRSPDGGKFVFRAFGALDAPGALERLVDTDGNALVLDYWTDFGTAAAPGWRGELKGATDASGRRLADLFYDLRGRVKEVRDATLPGRSWTYTYGTRGDLVRVRSPILDKTTEGEDLHDRQKFANGRAEVYLYTSGFADARLNHQLKAIVAPAEVESGGLLLLPPHRLEDEALVAPLAMCKNTYSTDPTSYMFGRVIEQELGGSGLLPAWTGQTTPQVAGGKTTLTYEALTVPVGASPNHPASKTTILDAGGDLKEYFLDRAGHLVRFREHANRNVRARGTGPGQDPAYFERTWVYNARGLVVAITNPSGSVWRWVFPDEDLNGDGALTPGVDTNSDGDFDDPEDTQPEDDARYAWKPGNGALDQARPEARFQHVRHVIEPDARGDSRGGQQPRVWTRSYEPIYQQPRTVTDPCGNDPTYRPQNGGVTSPARYTTTVRFDYEQGIAATASATGAALAQELGVTEPVLYQLLSEAGMALGQGDLNESPADDGFRAGHVVRVDEPSITVLPDQTVLQATYGTSIAVRSLFERNSYGQLIRSVDAEHNVHTVEYHPSANDATTGGFVKATVADDSSDARRNSGTNPTPVRVRSQFFQDAAGNVVRTIDPRGVEHRVALNLLFEPMKARTATAIVGPTLNEPTGAMQALDYEALFFPDANGRLVETRYENAGERDGTATTVAANPYWTSKTAFDRLGQSVLTLAEVEPLQDDDSITVSSNGVIVGRAAYYPNLLLKQVQKPEGNLVAFAYDERQLLFQQTDGFGSPDAATVTVHYNLNGNEQYVVDAKKHNPTKWTQFPTGDVLRTKYDGFDEVLCTTDQEYNCGDSVYSPDGRRVRFVKHGAPDDGMPRLLEVEHFYDEGKRPFRSEQRVFENGGTFSYATWDRSIPVVGDPAPLLPEREAVSRDERDALGRTLRALDPKDDESLVRWDGAGRVVSGSGPEFSALTGGIGPVRNDMTVAYNQVGQPVSITSTDRSPVSAAHTRSFTSFVAFDATGRLVEATDPAGQTARMLHDSRGLVIAMSDAHSTNLTTLPRTGFVGPVNGHGNVAHMFYDGIGRLVKSETLLKQNGVGDGQVNLNGVYTNLDTSNPTNTDGKITVAQRHDRNSRLVAKVDDNGNATQWVHDQRDRATFVIGADGTARRTIFDVDSLVAETVDPNGTRIAYSHDGAGRPVKAQVLRAATNLAGTGQSVEGTAVQGWEWDGLSRLRLATDQNDPADANDDVATSWTYDSLSNQLSERHRIRAQTTVNTVFTQNDRITVAAPALDRTIMRTFDLDSNRTSTTYSSGRQISYGLDGLDRVQRIVDGPLATGTSIQTMEWVGGRPLRADAGNGVRTDYGYDLKRRLTSLTHVAGLGAGSNVASFALTWDRSDRRQSETFTAQGLPTLRLDYGYDSASRLVRVGYTGGAAPRPPTTWLIDGVNNQVKRTEDGQTTALNVRQNGTYQAHLMNEVAKLSRFDALGALQSEEAHKQDPAGNRIQEGKFRLFWDAFDRLVRVERTADGAVVGRYRYDAGSRRVDRQFRIGSGPLEQAFHVHDGAQEVEELGASGSAEAEFVWGGLFVDHLVQMRRRTGATSFATSFFHQNSIFSVVAATGTSGSVEERYSYSSVYGAFQVQDVAGNPQPLAADIGNPYRFQGRRFDAETDFYYFRSRFLDPAQCRWVSRDPIGTWGDPGQLGSAYSSFGNDPSNTWDPFGLDGGNEVDLRLKDFDQAQKFRELCEEPPRGYFVAPYKMSGSDSLWEEFLRQGAEQGSGGMDWYLFRGEMVRQGKVNAGEHMIDDVFQLANYRDTRDAIRRHELTQIGSFIFWNAAFGVLPIFRVLGWGVKLGWYVAGPVAMSLYRAISGVSASLARIGLMLGRFFGGTSGPRWTVGTSGLRLSPRAGTFYYGGIRSQGKMGLFRTSVVRAGASRPPRHHLFPQQEAFQAYFQARGINIHQHTFVLNQGEHEAIHLMGFNALWEAFIVNNPNATTMQVLRFAVQMRRWFGIQGPRIPYNAP